MRHLGGGAGPQGARPHPLAGSYRPSHCPSLNKDKCVLIGARILYTHQVPWGSPVPPMGSPWSVLLAWPGAMPVGAEKDISQRAQGALLLAGAGALSSAANLSSAAAAAVSAESASGI